MTRRLFTEAEDLVIQEARAAGLSWKAIGAKLGTTGKTVKYRLKLRLGLLDPKVVQVGRRPEKADQADHEKRKVLEPGNPISWGAITAGTVIEGRPYR